MLRAGHNIRQVCGTAHALQLTLTDRCTDTLTAAGKKKKRILRNEQKSTKIGV